ncbi:MAG TPA: SCO family protein [Verrucomicrobiae bacterium]
MQSKTAVAVTNYLTIILPLPAGEGWGEGESFKKEGCAVHGEGESFEIEGQALHGENEWLVDFVRHKSNHRIAGFQTCCIADFQIGKSHEVAPSAGLETCDTADLEVCGTSPYAARLIPRASSNLGSQLVLFSVMVVFLLSALNTLAAQNTLTDAQLLQIKFDQKPGSQVSPDLVFRDETGKPVRLGDYFGKRPIVLIPGYYKCPMLCNLIMQGVIESLRDLRWSVGEQFDVIFISIDPREGPKLAADKKKLDLRDYGRAGTENGWHFLVAATSPVGRVASPGAPKPLDDKAIQTLADEIGFRFAYDAGLKQFAHPSGFVILTPDGKVAHYFFGVTFSAKEVDVALRHANARKTDSPVRDFILLCCEYSPLRGKYGNVIMDSVRVGGLGMVAALGIYFVRPIRRKTSG